ncbi:MAG: magnesium transporter [Alphaproteobacteria bacterium]
MTQTENSDSRTDADEVVDRALVREVSAALQADDPAAVHGLVDELHVADLADLIDILPRDRRAQLIDLLGDQLDPTVLPELEYEVLTDVLEQLTPGRIAAAVSALDTDDAIVVLEYLDEERHDQVLAVLPPPDRAAVEAALAFPEESAARLMQREFIAVPAFWTVGQVIDYCRETTDLPDDFYEIFVVDPRFRPLGQVPLNRLLRQMRPVIVRDIVETEVRPIPLDLDQEEVAFQFQQYRLTSAPVVDQAGRMIGVITFDDITDVVEEEAEEDLMRLSGLGGGETDLYANTLRTTRTRFVWLAMNLCTAILASFVIAAFDATIEQLVALAVLMPIVASMGGNAGTQTVTVAVRALATHELTTANAVRFFIKEVAVGGLNGVMFAVLMAAICFVWFQDVGLAAVIGAAMVVNLLVAGLAGTLIPLTLERFNIDPAVSAAVFLTTVTDVIGFFAFLGLAALFLL